MAQLINYAYPSYYRAIPHPLHQGSVELPAKAILLFPFFLFPCSWRIFLELIEFHALPPPRITMAVRACRRGRV